MSGLPASVLALLIIFLVTLLSRSPVEAMEQPLRMLIPMGGGYSDLYTGFSQAVIAHAQGKDVHILVLPLPYATDPESITAGERQENLQAAEERRFQIEEACKRTAPEGVACTATLAPILVRSDALDPAALDYFAPDLTAIFILGGDQTIAMQVISGTPVEKAMAEAYDRGVIIAGTSAGCGMQSAVMLGSYNLNFAAGNSLFFGASEVWHTPERHGLLFGMQDAILDQHFFQRGRVGRLLNAISLPDVPHVGVGVDAYTGVLAPEGKRLQGVFGLYVVAVLDAETYHAADSVEYVYPPDSPLPLLSLRNVLVNLIPPGDFIYDLEQRRFTQFGEAAFVSGPSPRLERAYETLALPSGAGALFLAGGLDKSLQNNPTLQRFVELSGGESARILVVAAGYPSDSSAQRTADKYAAALNSNTQTLVIPRNASEPPPLPEGITGILLVGRDQGLIEVGALPDLRAAWLSGTPILADGAAAAVLGQFYSAHGPVPEEGEEHEIAAQRSFLQGRTQIKPGLGLLNLTVEPDVLGNNRWGRLFSLAYNHPEIITIGLNSDTALVLDDQGATAWGKNAVFVLDNRYASLTLGTNEGFAIANGFLDVFAPGEAVKPRMANSEAVYVPAPTPDLSLAVVSLPPTAVSTEPPTNAPTASPTKSPSPAATPPAGPIPSQTTPEALAEAKVTSWPLYLGAALVIVLLITIQIVRRRI